MRRRILEDHLHLCQDRAMPDLLSLQNAPQQTLMSSSRVRQDERHANVAVRWTLATPHARGPEALLRGGSVESWYVDTDS